VSIKKSMEDLLSELISEVKNLKATSTEMAGHLKGGITNDVLAVGIYAFDQDKRIFLDFPTPYGCVQVTNHHGGALVVAASTPQDLPPTTGRGFYKVDGFKAAIIDLHGRALTLYTTGAPGDRVSLQVFTRPWPPGSVGGA
jgi:hypothetical protein